MRPVDWASPDKATNLRIALDSFHREISARFQCRSQTKQPTEAGGSC